jgi:hypothetical protein
MKEIVTYLNFDGTARLAMELRQKCLAGVASDAVRSALGQQSAEVKDRSSTRASRPGGKIMARTRCRHAVP